MPRLTETEYLQHHFALHTEWLQGADAFVLLTAPEEVALHDFYEPSLDLSEDQLQKLRRLVTKADPSLPQRAGKAYVQIAPFLGQKTDLMTGTITVSPGRRKNMVRVTTVESLVQPRLDPAQIGRALVEAAMEEARRQRLRATPLPGAPAREDQEDEAA